MKPLTVVTSLGSINRRTLLKYLGTGILLSSIKPVFVGNSAYAYDEKKPKEDQRVYPQEPLLRLTLSTKPSHSNFTRYLTFQNHKGQQKRLAVAFKKTSDLVWESQDFPDGIGVLKQLVETGNRSYWDRMYLENRGGTTALALKHILIQMNYKVGSSILPPLVPIVIPPGRTGTMEKDNGKIPIVNTAVNTALASGDHKIALDAYAVRSRYAWAGIDSKASSLIKAVAQDLGKSGSDGKGDAYGKNPKYRGDIYDLCSEFVSWYYHEQGIYMAGHNFRDIEGTSGLRDVFQDAKQMYHYKRSEKRFVHEKTGQPYTPQPGDFLERRGDDKDGKEVSEHSMIMLGWIGNTAEPEALVFNGPWPVTLRRVRVHYDELNKGKDFCLGRLVPDAKVI